MVGVARHRRRLCKERPEEPSSSGRAAEPRSGSGVWAAPPPGPGGPSPWVLSTTHISGANVGLSTVG